MDATNNPYPSILLAEGATPTAVLDGPEPVLIPQGDQRLFLDVADHRLKRVNSSGVVTVVEGTGATVPSYPNDASLYLNGAGAWTTPSATVLNVSDTGVVTDWGLALKGDTVIYWNGASDATVTGIAGGVRGQRLMLVNSGGANLYLSNQDARSQAANRLWNAVSSGPTPVAQTGSAVYSYSGTPGNIWKLVAHDQGPWITPPYSAANYTGYNGNSWTVTAGQVLADRYLLRGRTLLFTLYLNGTTVGGSASSYLARTAYGYSTTGTMAGTILAAAQGGTVLTPIPLAQGSQIVLQSGPTGAYYAAGNCTLYGTSSLEVT